MRLGIERATQKQKGLAIKRCKSKMKKVAKDPNKPKRPASAFFVFMEDFRKQYKEKHPHNKSISVVGKAGGEKWKSMTNAEKAPFVANAEKRRAEYEKTLDAYRKKLASKTSYTASDSSSSDETSDEESDSCKIRTSLLNKKRSIDAIRHHFVPVVKKQDDHLLVGPTGLGEMVEVGAYKVRPNNAPTLSKILDKYGDIAAHCIYKSPLIRSSLLEVICNIVYRLQNDVICNLVKNEISEVEATKIDVSWLHQHLEKMNEVKRFSQRSVSLKSTRVTSTIVTKVASREMEERHAKLKEAQKQFEESESFVKAMKIVMKKIDDEIIESEAEEYFWRRRLFDFSD